MHVVVMDGIPDTGDESIGKLVPDNNLQLNPFLDRQQQAERVEVVTVRRATDAR